MKKTITEKTGLSIPVKVLLLISSPVWIVPYLAGLLIKAVWKKYRVRLLLKWHRADIEKLVNCFLDDKYPATGIARTPAQLIEQCKKEFGWKARRFNRVISFCVECDIIQDHPMNKKSKQFFYIINPEHLK